jgi:phosphoserine aminotransferase
MKKHIFNAGPSVLPKEVILEASEAIKEYNRSGLSILEISHRSKDFIEIIEEAKSSVLELLNLPSDYKVLFLHGGASLQFSMVPMNLMKPAVGSAAYVDTGSWSAKAIKDAKLFGEVSVIASSKEEGYGFIPKLESIEDSFDYVHLTANNTIYGTQFKSFPKTNSPLVCDMSSDIFSRNLDFSQFDLIYAGVQKNSGAAGTTIVVVKDQLLENLEKDQKIPSMLSYKAHLEKDSLLNTPAVYAVYISLLTLRWIKKNGGIQGMEQRNNEKSSLLYKEIDRNPMIKGFVSPESRSSMNATFEIIGEENKNLFEKLCEDAGIVGIKGHRSIGGYRASMYNALALESVVSLVEVMQNIEKKSYHLV